MAEEGDLLSLPSEYLYPASPAKPDVRLSLHPTPQQSGAFLRWFLTCVPLCRSFEA